MRKKQRRRPRRNEEQWVEILRRFSTSQLSAKEFCKRESLTLSSFHRWRRQLGSSKPPEFVELTPTQQAVAQPTGWSLDVSLPNGVCLRFQG